MQRQNIGLSSILFVGRNGVDITLGIIVTEETFQFKFISPEILRGGHWDDFLLFYMEGERELRLAGRLPRGDQPGYLDFPDCSTWVSRVPQWTMTKRDVIEQRLLDYAKNTFSLKWLTLSNFAPVPCPPPLTEAEVQANIAFLEVAQNEYLAIRERTRVQSRANAVGNIVWPLVILGAVILIIVAEKLGVFP